MIRPSKILSALALDLVKQMEQVGAAAAVLVVVTLVSARVEDRIEARLEARREAAEEARADEQAREWTDEAQKPEEAPCPDCGRMLCECP